MAKKSNVEEVVMVQEVAEMQTAEKEKKPEKKEVELEDLPGIGPSTAEKLRRAGYDTIVKIATSSPYELEEVADLGVETGKRAISAARDALEMGYERADKILERRKVITRITTGSSELDGLIGGGVETQAITEAFGKFSSGKSQLGFQLAVNAQLPVERGGLGGSVLFIDTESTFRPERIKQLAEALKMDPDQVLKNIHVAKAVNSDHQMLLIEKSEEIIKRENIKLIIIDSLTSHFRTDYIGRGALSERQQKLNKHIHALQRLADQNNLAVYITNQVMDNPGILFGDPTTPIGGHVLAHAATYRLYFRKSKEEKRIAKLVDSPSMPEGECVFRVTPEGVRD
ncbi:DNA repair and recombination protein RadA [Candidatus Gugararchaeum adminiculabundum]|nr:DNA repair and recombination protein RadA [Candidatus Gugararchaeum adminiculabundum]